VKLDLNEEGVAALDSNCESKSSEEVAEEKSKKSRGKARSQSEQAGKRKAGPTSPKRGRGSKKFKPAEETRSGCKPRTPAKLRQSAA
jgi:hypothetical protein